MVINSFNPLLWIYIKFAILGFSLFTKAFHLEDSPNCDF